MLHFFPVGSVSDTIKTNLESNVKKTNVALSILSVLSKNLVLWKLAVQQKTCIQSRHDPDFGKSIYTFAFIYKVRIGIFWNTLL